MTSAQSPLLAGFVVQAERASSRVGTAAGAWTYREILEGARRVAAFLGPLRGARVALLVTPGEGFVEALFGVLVAGGCAVILSPLHPEAETAYFCADADVATALVSPELASHLAGVPVRAVPLPDAKRAEAVEPPGALAGDAALQLYTSGTTGKPKGAVLTHANLATQQALLVEAWGFSQRDVLLHTLPLHHMHGVAIALLTAIGAGAGVHMLSPFDAGAVWDAMGRATVFMAVPTIYAKLLAAFEEAPRDRRAAWEANARGLRLATSGSAALPTSIGERWRALAGSYPLERFGMTEIGVGSSNPLLGERKPGTVGKPLPTVETRVVSSEPSSDEGELWVSGPSVFAGYYKREEATREAFVVEAGVRWFKTGDTVRREPDGTLRILGRTSVDILKSGGYKLSALEIEEVLLTHPAVAEVAVVGLPDEVWGERVVACVVARASSVDGDEASLRAFAKTRLAAYKVPRTFLFMKDLPRNAVGKVVKPELVKRIG